MIGPKDGGSGKYLSWSRSQKLLLKLQFWDGKIFQILRERAENVRKKAVWMRRNELLKEG